MYLWMVKKSMPWRGILLSFEKLAGERVNVVGMLEGDTIKVKAVAHT